jgi:dTDP-4-dehydrorhamnose 3,5-epimerase
MKITVVPTEIEGLVLINTDFFKDERGFFIEPWNKKTYSEAGLNLEIVQEGHSGSKKNTLRGLHYQDMTAPMGKLVRCTAGSVLDVAVDLRTNSRTFKKWFSVELNSDLKNQIYVPVGFAHGFCVLTDWAEVQYKQTAFYTPSAEGSIIWNDPELNISWPVTNPLLSEKDKNASTLADYIKNPAFT